MTAAGGGGRPADATLGAQVRAARMAQKISLRALSHRLGVSPATVSQIENGRTGLSVVRLGQIADVLNLTVPQILDIVVDPEAPDVSPASASPHPPSAAHSTAENGDPPDWRTYAPLDFDPVLRAALEEILEIGYHGATVRGIASRCDLSVSGLYHYYTSKQHMLLTILDRTMTELLQRAETARSEGRDPVERFSLLIEHLALFHTHRRELGFVGASEMRSLDTENRIKIATMRTRQQRMVDEEVEAAVRDGQFRNDHPHEASRAVVTMCTALPNWWRPDGPLSAERVAQQYVGFALDLMQYRSVAARFPG
ncbi:helix-turn-helix domain-containing protein (plasmid) [Pseudonocardia bannensis]|uniref:TetR family transcriptional regulator n=1 Tax=Pseudonocardia bannensis TaxID=630973 RepID=A0A848DRZ9_9PSEU|nr:MULTISPECIES: helix-turn-helix domain-containing protein [Pseudonocardia]NMH95622.1 TetR family transcriptional regulator [Pseudonocardia bannensis]